MTPIQQQVVQEHEAEGFQIVSVERDVVRLTKGADARLVRQDGVIKRAQHQAMNVRVIGGVV